MKKLALLVLFTLLVMRLMLASAQDETQRSWIRITNFVQDTPPLVIYLNDELLLDGITAPSISNYIKLSAPKLHNDLDIPHVERPGYLFVDGVYIPDEGQATFTLSFFPTLINNPLNVPHVHRPGYLFIDGVYIRLDEGISLIDSIPVTVKPQQFYTIILFGQRADGTLQVAIINDTETLVATV